MIGAALFLLTAGMALPLPQTQIAERIASGGMPDCSRYQLDGSIAQCLPEFRIKAGVHVNASSEDGVISFTRASLTRLSTDEFALLAGHEIAHFYLGHTSSNPGDELAADRLGAELACSAGFDPVAGMGLFRHLAAGKSHPRASDRRKAVLEAPCRVLKKDH